MSEHDFALLRQEVSDWAGTTNDLSEALDRIEDTISQLTKELEVARVDAAAQKAGHAQCERNMDAEIERLQKELEEAESSLVQYHEDNESLQKELEEARTALEEEENLHYAALDTIESLQKELDTLRAAALAFVAKVEPLRDNDYVGDWIVEAADGFRTALHSQREGK